VVKDSSFQKLRNGSVKCGVSTIDCVGGSPALRSSVNSGFSSVRSELSTPICVVTYLGKVRGSEEVLEGIVKAAEVSPNVACVVQNY
jgi:hypothetical protein